jgi:hypothetical protein
VAHIPTLAEQDQGKQRCGCVVDRSTGQYSAVCSPHWPLRNDPLWAPYMRGATEVDHLG